MHIYLDVDAISKLSHWGLLNEIPRVLGIEIESHSTVGSLRFRASKSISSPDGKLFRNIAAAQYALEFINRGVELPDIEPDNLLVYEDIPGIDPGEAILLAALAQNKHAILLTGDKRAVKAVIALNNEVVSRISGRVIIIEQVVLAALLAYDINWLRAQICPQKHIDKSISIIMGAECLASRESLIDGLNSFIHEVENVGTKSFLAKVC